MSLPHLEDCILDHVAVAVVNLEESVAHFSHIGLVFDSKREVVSEQKVKTAFAPLDKHAHLELLETTSSDGPIGKYIAKNGPGIHHLCFKVKDIVVKQQELEALGMRFIYEKPKSGAHGHLVNFIHPKSTSGILIELSQHISDK